MKEKQPGSQSDESLLALQNHEFIKEKPSSGCVFNDNHISSSLSSSARAGRRYWVCGAGAGACRGNRLPT
jgi:hypothetical protein